MAATDASVLPEVAPPPPPEFVSDILAQLDAGTAKLREEDATLRVKPGGFGRLPRIEDAFLAQPVWKPPSWHNAAAEAAELYANGHRVRPSFCGTSHALEEFTPFKTLKGKVLDTWTITRIGLSERSYRKPRGFAGYRSHPGGDEPPTHDGMCGQQHREWLTGHYERRAAHLRPVAHAMREVKEQEAELKRTQEALASEAVDEKTKEALKAREQSLHRRLSRTRSNPILTLRAQTPAGQHKHLRRWSMTTEKAQGTFQQTTPWQGRAEEREVDRRGYTVTRAMAGGGCTAKLPKIRRHSASKVATMAPRQQAANNRTILPPTKFGNATLHPNSPLRPGSGRPGTGAFGSSRASSPAPRRPTGNTQLPKVKGAPQAM